MYGPSTTLYNRFRRWTMRGIWRRLFDALARADPGDGQAIDSTTARLTARRRAEKGGAGAGDWPLARRAHHENPRHRRRARTPHRHRSDAGHLGDVRVATALISGVPAGGRLAADTAYDSDGLRRFLLERGTVPVIPNNPTRKRHHPFDETAYRQRNLIERMVCRLKDWRRIATRYDKLAANFAAAVMIAAVIIWWT